MIDNECWWRGPAFLSQTSENWPEGEFTGATAETLEEVKAEVRERTDRPQQDSLNSFVTSKQKENQWRLDPTRTGQSQETSLKLEFLCYEYEVRFTDCKKHRQLP